MLFRSLGLRHLTVVDAHNRVKGILTRKVTDIMRTIGPADVPTFAADLFLCLTQVMLAVHQQCSRALHPVIHSQHPVGCQCL